MIFCIVSKWSSLRVKSLFKDTTVSALPSPWLLKFGHSSTLCFFRLLYFCFTPCPLILAWLISVFPSLENYLLFSPSPEPGIEACHNTCNNIWVMYVYILWAAYALPWYSSKDWEEEENRHLAFCPFIGVSARVKYSKWDCSPYNLFGCVPETSWIRVTMNTW